MNSIDVAGEERDAPPDLFLLLGVGIHKLTLMVQITVLVGLAEAHLMSTKWAVEFGTSARKEDILNNSIQ